MTLELETPPFPGALENPARSAAERAWPPVQAAPPWRLAAERWERLEPVGLYARRARGPLLWLAALALTPLALLVALPVALGNALEHGPRRVFFLQKRVGKRGRIFVLFKFRTMRDVPGADHSRVTSFGRFLRNTHLDELPQLVNVLCGDMCLIGPRPEMLATERWAAHHCPDFWERLVLPPGLTGYAQITQGYTNGGDAEAYRRKLELNHHYRERLSLGLDLAILCRTALWMVRGRGWRKA